MKVLTRHKKLNLYKNPSKKNTKVRAKEFFLLHQNIGFIIIAVVVEITL